MATIIEKQLGQLRPGTTTATSIYSPPASTNTIIKSLVVCNQGGSDIKFSIFIDDDGTTYDESTALFWDVEIKKDTTVQIDTYYAMDDSAGNIAVKTTVASELTFTIFGAEIS